MMALNERQHAAILHAHDQQMRQLQHTVALKTPDELHALKRVVAELADSIAWEERRRASFAPDTAVPAAPVAATRERVHYGRGAPKLSDTQIRAMRSAYAASGNDRLMITRLVEHYGVHRSTVVAIVKRKIQADVD